MFDLNKDRVRIANVNARAEKHGDDDVLACDIKCEARMANAVLSKFSPTLKSCLYTKDDGATEDMLNPDHMPKLRNPQMGTIKWDFEMPSVQFRVHHGESDDDDIVFSDGKAGNFTLTCQEGGTVIVGFRVQVHPDELEAAKLLTLLNKEVKVSLINELGEGGEGEGGQSSGDGTASGNDLLTGAEAATETLPLPEGLEIGDSDDELYPQAVAVVLNHRHASISLLQRHLRIGYNRASRLLQDMEGNDLVGPMCADREREILIPASDEAAPASTDNDSDVVDAEFHQTDAPAEMSVE